MGVILSYKYFTETTFVKYNYAFKSVKPLKYIHWNKI